MISIAEKIEELINQSPYLREAISDGLVNLSALARQIRPKIEKQLLKTVTTGAVLIALQRYAATLQPYYQVNPADYLANMEMRFDLFELTVKNSPDLLQKLSILATKVHEQRTNMFIFTQGRHETTILTSKILQKHITDTLKDEEITSTIHDLTGIALQRTHGQIERTGVLQFPLRILAWEGISVIEIVTTLSEIMIVVRDFEADRAVTSIHQALRAVKQAA